MENFLTNSKNIETTLSISNCVKKEVYNIEAYFDSLGGIEDSKFNTKILYEENSIEFISINGEKFNLKLKNKIEKIYALSDGILIKLDYPIEEFQFFKNSKNKDKLLLSKTQGKKKNNNSNNHYRIYYLINCHPLNTISIVKNNLNETGFDCQTYENIYNFIYVNYELPLLINLRRDGELDLFCLVYKNYEEKIDFKNYLGKILHSAYENKNKINIGDNFNMFLNESRYCFYQLISDFAEEFHTEFYGNYKQANYFKEEKRNRGYNKNFSFKNFNEATNEFYKEDNLEIKFFNNYSEEFALFLSIFNKANNNLMIFKMEFPNTGNYLEAKISQKKFLKNVSYYSFIENIFNDFTNQLYIEKNEIENKYLDKIHFYKNDEKLYFIKDTNKKDISNNNKNKQNEKIDENSTFYIYNSLLQFRINEKMHIYMKDQKKRIFSTLFYCNEADEIVFLENMDIIFKINIQENHNLFNQFNTSYNKIDITNNKYFKVKNLYYEKKIENFIVLIEKIDLKIKNDYKYDIIPYKFDIPFKFDSIILMNILQFFNIAFEYIKLKDLEKNIVLTAEEHIILINSTLYHEKQNVFLNKIFIKGLCEYIIYRKNNNNRISDNFYHKQLNKRKLAKYFFEYICFLIYTDYEEIKKEETIISENLSNHSEKINNESIAKNLNLTEDERFLMEKIPIFNEKIKNKILINSNSDEISYKKNKEINRKKKFFRIKEFWNINKLQKTFPDLIFLKKILDFYKIFKYSLTDFCCELYESLKIFNFNQFKFENESYINNKFDSDLTIFSAFLLTQISNFEVVEKMRYLDFLNYNFGVKFEKKLIRKSFNAERNKIISDADLINIFILNGNMKNRNKIILKYDSLTKFVMNFVNGILENDNIFAPIFRNVNEIIIILIMHFYKKDKFRLLNMIFEKFPITLISKENTQNLKNEFDISYTDSNINNLNILRNSQDKFKLSCNQIYERDLNNISCANQREINPSSFRNYSASNFNVNNNYNSKGLLEDFCIYSREIFRKNKNNKKEKITSFSNFLKMNQNNHLQKFNNESINCKLYLNEEFNNVFREDFQKFKINLNHNIKIFLMTQKSEIFSPNFAVSLIVLDLTLEKIKEMMPCISLIFLEKIANMKINTNSYNILLENNPGINQKILNLIGRIDMARNLKVDSISSYIENYQSKKIKENKNTRILSKMIYQEENITSFTEQEYYLANLKFNSDSRFYEALRILNPYSHLKINSEFLKENNSPNNNIMDPDKIEKEKLQIAYKNILKQLSTYFGAGALNLNLIKNFPKDILNMKQINTTILFSHDNTSLKADFNSEQFLNYLTVNNYNSFYNMQTLSNNTNREKEILKWPEFHSGVSQAIKLSSEFLTSNNSSYIRNWILFNKPNPQITNTGSNSLNGQTPQISLNPEHQHGGFIFGMGLLKVLDNLYSTDIYQYMKSAQEGITIGIMLGRAVSKISTMEDSTSRTLCLHISYLIPASLEINIPMSVQCAAVFSLGLLYQNTCNRLMTEMLLNQIGKKVCFEKTQNFNLVESYNLSLGFAIGLINLGLGNYTKLYNEDLKLEDKLLNFANGGKKFEIAYSQNRSFYNYINNSLNHKGALSGNAAAYQLNLSYTGGKHIF